MTQAHADDPQWPLVDKKVPRKNENVRSPLN